MQIILDGTLHHDRSRFGYGGIYVQDADLQLLTVLDAYCMDCAPCNIQR